MDAKNASVAGIAASALAAVSMGAGLAAAAGMAPASAQAAEAGATFAPQGQVVTVEQYAAARAGATVRVPDVRGVFAFSQAEVTPTDAIARSMGKAPVYLCGASAQTLDAGALASEGEEGEPLSWTISVGGAVEHPFEATISEMAGEDCAQTQILGCSCSGNPADGLASINAEVTGVPVVSLLGHAVPAEGANTIVFTSADGYEVALPLRYVEQHYCPIVFDVNGSPIAESMGGSNQLWLGSTSARYFARDIVAITLEARDEADVPAAPGSPEAGDDYANLPNVGVYFGGEVA